MQPGEMFDENCKGCRIDEATKWEKKCPYLAQVMGEELTVCYCCEDHVDVCQEAVNLVSSRGEQYVPSSVSS